MYKFIRKNQKKMLAISTAFLMIAFLIPTFGRKSDGDQVVGKIGEKPVHLNEVVRARREWDLLKGQLFVRVPDESGTSRGVRWVPLAEVMGPAAYQQIEGKTDLYLLLQREAQDMGIVVDSEQVDRLIKTEIQANFDTSDPARADDVRQAVTHFLLVRDAYQRSADVIKVSDPYRRYELANQLQSIKVNLVEYSAKDFQDKVAAPTTQDASKQFADYADKDPDKPDAANRFAFGYRYPDRVMVQYLEVPRDQVEKAVKASKTDYDWSVAAHKYYSKHRSEFPTTQPDPLSQSPLSLGPIPALAVRPATRPTTRPFDEVKDELLENVRKPDVDKLAETIQAKINSTLAADWMSYHKAVPATQTATTQTVGVPASSLGVPYNSYDYLQRLAADIQKQHGVLPTVSQLPEWLSAKDLAVIGRISQARAGNADFARYATLLDGPSALLVFQPSHPLRDMDNNLFFFRLTGVQRAHMPDQGKVAARIDADLRMVEAYNMATKAAQELLASAKKDGLSSAAAAAKAKVIATGTFNRRPGMPVTGYPLPEPGNSSFVVDAFKLLVEAGKTGNPHPISVIELPRLGKVVVAQLDDVKAGWDQSTRFYFDLRVTQEVAGQLQQQLEADWFNYDSVAARLGYSPAERSTKKSGEPEPSTPPPGPLPLLGG